MLLCPPMVLMRLRLDCLDLSRPYVPGDVIEAFERRTANSVIMQGFIRFHRHFRRA